MSTDFNQFDLGLDQAVMDVIHPTTGEPIVGEDEVRAQITVLSSDSREYARREREATRKYARRRGRIHVDEVNLDRAVAATVAVHGILLDGNEVTPANVRQLYERHRWLVDDVLGFMHERSNYQGN